MKTYQGTIILAVPTMLIAMLEHPDFDRRDRSSLRTVMSGAATVNSDLVGRTKERFGCAFTNVYGQTKLDGETAVLKSPGTVVLRVPVLYGPTDPKENNKESAVNILMDSLWKSQKETVKMDDWAIRYPTNVEDVARVCLDIAKLYTSSPHPEKLPRISVPTR